jgi:hypothetical protein
MLLLDANHDSTTSLVIVNTLISAAIAIAVVLLKNPLERKFLERKLQLEYNFGQRKQIKAALGRHKINIALACDSLKLRMWHWANRMDHVWDKESDFYSKNDFFLHSTAYLILSVYAHIQLLQQDLTILDTTLAEPDDYEFVKLIQVFLNIFSNTREIDVYHDREMTHKDHFSRVLFATFPVSLIHDDKVRTFTDFKLEIESSDGLKLFLSFLDQTTQQNHENRWERLHLLYFTVIIFLNNFGYSFQKTREEEIRAIIRTPQKPHYLQHYLRLLHKYELKDNPAVQQFERIAVN